MSTAPAMSQSDIDALLKGVASEASDEAAGEPSAPETDKRKIKEYDFRRPDKFSKDNLRAIQMVFEFFARLLSSSLSAHLRGNVSAHLTQVEQVLYDEYVQQLPSPTVVSLISMDPLPDQAIIEINMPLAFSMIDRMLGGTGQGSDIVREVTDIEEALIRSTMKLVLRAYREAWANVQAIEPELQDLVYNAAFIQAAVPGAVAVLGVVEVNVMGMTGTISTAIPYTVLEPVMSRLTAQAWLTVSNKSGMGGTEMHDEHLSSVKLSICAILGRGPVAFKEMLALKPGHIIRLDTAVGGDIEIAVGNQHTFFGRPGRVGRRVAIQLTKMAEEA